MTEELILTITALPLKTVKKQFIVSGHPLGAMGPYSVAPLCEAARDLILMGADTEQLVTGKTAPSEIASLVPRPLWYWAKWTIEEGDIGTKRRVYKPMVDVIIKK